MKKTKKYYLNYKTQKEQLDIFGWVVINNKVFAVATKLNYFEPQTPIEIPSHLITVAWD